MEKNNNPSRGKIILPLILCFLAAVIVWLTVMHSASPTVTRELKNIPIVKKEGTPNLDERYACLYEKTIPEVSFEGTRRDFLLCNGDVTAVLDLSTVGPTVGEYDCSVRFQFSEHVALTEIKPITVKVTVVQKQ